MRNLCIGGAPVAAAIAGLLLFAAPAGAQNASFPPYPQTSRAPGPSADLIDIHSISDPQRTITGAIVRDMDGQRIGEVRHVETDETGAAVAADVVFRAPSGARRYATIPSQDLRFDQRSRSVLTDLSMREVESLPR